MMKNTSSITYVVGCAKIWENQKRVILIVLSLAICCLTIVCFKNFSWPFQQYLLGLRKPGKITYAKMIHGKAGSEVDGQKKLGIEEKDTGVWTFEERQAWFSDSVEITSPARPWNKTHGMLFSGPLTSHAIKKIKEFTQDTCILEIGSKLGLWAKQLEQEGIAIYPTEARLEEVWGKKVLNSKEPIRGSLYDYYHDYPQRHYFWNPRTESMEYYEAILKYSECDVLLFTYPVPNFPSTPALKLFNGSRFLFYTTDPSYHDPTSSSPHYNHWQFLHFYVPELKFKEVTTLKWKWRWNFNGTQWVNASTEQSLTCQPPHFVEPLNQTLLDTGLTFFQRPNAWKENDMYF